VIRWKKSAVFFILVIGLLIFLENLSTPPLGQSQSENGEAKKNALKKKMAKLDKSSKMKAIAQFKLYDEGEIYIDKKKNKIQIDEKFQVKQIKNSHPNTSLLKKKKKKIASENIMGKWPILEVDYERIGFEQYLVIIQRLGRTFLLVKTDAGIRLGPEISFDKNRIFQEYGDLSSLALERPHLISDQRMLGLLRSLDVSGELVTGQVVLLLDKSIDVILWDHIQKILDDHDVKLTQISKISGVYAKREGHIYFDLKSAIMRNKGQNITLSGGVKI